MDGYEMVRRIRETDGFIPIVCTSGRVSPKDVVKGYELGVNNYIKKPFLAEELDAHIGALLKMKRGMGPACCAFSFTVLAAFPVLDAAWAVFPAV